ncbi:MAG: protein DpdH [Bryobacteraceae bacterium]
MDVTDLLVFWPKEDDLVACVKTDAEAASEAVSQAVHQPITFERRVIGGDGGNLQTCGEYEILRALLEPNLSDGRVILPVSGSSGTGKSHVVRWLDAEIRKLPGADKRVVIRIPKGTSLKGVLGILLSHIQASQYESFRQQLLRAQNELDPEESAGLLCEMLAQTLSDMYNEARRRLLDAPRDANALLLSAYCSPVMLPSLLRNQHLRDSHFVRGSSDVGVVRRLVEQLTVSRSAGDEDDRQHQFTVADLIFANTDRSQLGPVEQRALSQLDREERRREAVRILNLALDGAKQRLLRLDPTVADLFDAVRAQLFNEGKELVLLVEDFVVLSGIQKQILQVIIKEAFRDGRQVLCTIRTVLAYTTGYMDAATVLTRASVEYRIPDEPGSEDEIFERIERLVGAYLNAARLGQATVENAYTSNSKHDSGSWIPRFTARLEPEVQATLECFGRTVDGHELFPFNALAVREFSREGCVQNGKLVFNPRYVIQHVLNRVLKNRDLFARRQFPPNSFTLSDRPLPAAVVQELQRRVNPRDIERYVPFLTYWAGFPSSIAEVERVHSRVFEAFGLDKARFGRDLQNPVLQPRPQVSESHPVSEPRPEASQNPLEVKWQGLLERWRAGVQLQQADALTLRKWIADALASYVMWDWILFRPRKDGDINSFFEYVYIPNAAGNAGRGADKSMTALCTDEVVQDSTQSASVVSAVLAIVRYHGVYKTWDYDGAEDDLARYSALMSRMAADARRFVKKRYFKAEWNGISALTQVLLTGARLLGVDGATRDRDHASLIASLFAPANLSDADLADSQSSQWIEFLRMLQACRQASPDSSGEYISWTQLLLDHVGARQGGAEKVHAIDVWQLKSAVEGTVTTWKLDQSPPVQAGVAVLKGVRERYNELKRLAPVITAQQSELVKWHDEAIEWLGADFDKEELVKEMKDLITVAKAAGLSSGINSQELIRNLEDFRTAKIVTALDDVGKLVTDPGSSTILSVLGERHDRVVVIARRTRSAMDEFLRTVDTSLANEFTLYGEDPENTAIGALVAEVTEFQFAIEMIEALWD